MSGRTLRLQNAAVNLIEIVQAKRVHIERFANQGGAAGEAVALSELAHGIARPKGNGLKVLLEALRETGVAIKCSSLDAISLPNESLVDFSNAAQVKAALRGMCFVAIKSASQSRLRPGFSGFFFALTESEVVAAEALGPRHRVALYNRPASELQLTSVPEISARTKSSNWQLPVQL